MKKTIVVLCGGQSTEHEIALRSARTVINELDRSKYRIVAYFVDKAGRFLPLGEPGLVEKPEDLIVQAECSRLESIQRFLADMDQIVSQAAPETALSEQLMIFPVIHGQSGEDGQIQGFLQMLGLPYVGNGLMASALCMDKGFTNQIFTAQGIAEAAYLILERHEWAASDLTHLADRVEKALGFPCFVKPCNNGSSVGVTKADRAHLAAALEEAFRYDNKILIEEAIIGHELEVSVIGNEDARASQPGSYTSRHEVLDYEAKYWDKSLVENVPHPLSPEKLAEIQALALRAYHALGCEGLARVDIFMDRDGRFLVNEINTLPGMTPTSLAPKLWTALTDMTFSDYLDLLIDYGARSDQGRKAFKNSWERL